MMMLIPTSKLIYTFIWLIPFNKKITGSLEGNTQSTPASSTQNWIQSKNMTLFRSSSTVIKLLNFLFDNTMPSKIPGTKHRSRERSLILNSLWQKVITYSMENPPQVKHLRLKKQLITNMIYPVSKNIFDGNGEKKNNKWNGLMTNM